MYLQAIAMYEGKPKLIKFYLESENVVHGQDNAIQGNLQ